MMYAKDGGRALRTFGAGIFGANAAQCAHQPVQSECIEIVERLFRGQLGGNQLQLLLGIIDERAQLAYVGRGQLRAKQLGDLAADIARCVAYDMAEGIALAVEVGHEVLRTLGEIHYRLKIDNL